MKLHNAPVILLLWLAFVLAGCAGTNLEMGSAEKTAQLKPGMTYQEVVNLLGEPKSSQSIGGQWVVRWTLHEMWKGYVPYDLQFDPKTKTLQSWAANEAEYQKSQAFMQQLAQSLSAGNSAGGGAGGSAGGGAAATGPNDPQLMQQMAGSYYSFSSAGMGYSGGTERKVMLCPDGRYYDNSESSYSGGAGTADAWGAAGQRSGGGTWRIQGNMQQGTITTVNASGNATNYSYRRCASDCVYFGNTKFAYAGPPQCP